MHDLVLRDPDGDLAQAYQAVGNGSDPDQVDLWPRFQAVVADQRHEIDEMLRRTRDVQTNEVGRSAALVPALTWLSEQMGAPLALIELGCSAGLNLLADHYRITCTRPVTAGCRWVRASLRCSWGARCTAPAARRCPTPRTTRRLCRR